MSITTPESLFYDQELDDKFYDQELDKSVFRVEDSDPFSLYHESNYIIEKSNLDFLRSAIGALDDDASLEAIIAPVDAMIAMQEEGNRDQFKRYLELYRLTVAHRKDKDFLDFMVKTQAHITLDAEKKMKKNSNVTAHSSIKINHLNKTADKLTIIDNEATDGQLIKKEQPNSKNQFIPKTKEKKKEKPSDIARELVQATLHSSIKSAKKLGKRVQGIDGQKHKETIKRKVENTKEDIAKAKVDKDLKSLIDRFNEEISNSDLPDMEKKLNEVEDWVKKNRRRIIAPVIAATLLTGSFNHGSAHLPVQTSQPKVGIEKSYKPKDNNEISIDNAKEVANSLIKPFKSAGEITAIGTAANLFAHIAKTGKMPDGQPVDKTLMQTVLALSQARHKLSNVKGQISVKAVVPESALSNSVLNKTTPKTSEAKPIQAANNNQVVILSAPSPSDVQSLIKQLSVNGANTLIANPAILQPGMSNKLDNQKVDSKLSSLGANLAPNELMVGFMAEQLTAPNFVSPNSTTSTSNTENAPIQHEGLNDKQLQYIDSLNLTLQQKNFLAQVSSAVIAAYLDGAKINPEAVIAQAIDESSWGTSELGSRYDNLFGMKAGTNWKGEVVTLPTEEFYNGQYVHINAQWEVYPNIAADIKGYVEFISSSPYFADAAACYKDTLGYLNGLEFAINKQCQIVGNTNLKYATDPTYVSQMMDIIDSLGINKIVSLASINDNSNTLKSNQGPTTTTTTATNSVNNIKLVPSLPKVNEHKSHPLGLSHNR